MILAACALLGILAVPLVIAPFAALIIVPLHLAARFAGDDPLVVIAAPIVALLALGATARAAAQGVIR